MPELKKLKSYILLLGKTPDGRPVFGGAFQMADTHGFPLWATLDEAKEKGFVISMPHYFASAMEHGWTDEMTFINIREALVEIGNPDVFEKVKQGCIAMFMKVAATMPDQPATEIGKRMRELLENNNTIRLVQPQPAQVPTAPVDGVPPP